MTEGILPDAGDAVWDYITSLIFTIRIGNYDCLIFIEKNSILSRIILIVLSKPNRSKPGAMTEGIYPDACDTVRDRNTCQTGAIVKGIISNVGHTFRYCDTAQTGAFFEGRFPDAGDAVWDRDTCQAGAIFEGPNTYAGDRLPFDSTWNGKFT